MADAVIEPPELVAVAAVVAQLLQNLQAHFKRRTARRIEGERRWLLAHSASTDATHLVHAPSNPPGWTAGKWMEWYPDALTDDGKLTTKQRAGHLRFAEQARRYPLIWT